LGQNVRKHRQPAKPKYMGDVLISCCRESGHRQAALSDGLERANAISIGAPRATPGKKFNALVRYFFVGEHLVK
jgi:hypothetical protein